MPNMITVSSPDFSKLRKGSVHLFCGFPKSGKTTAISTFGDRGSESVITIDVDNGTDYIEDMHRIKVYSLLPPTVLKDGNWEIIPPLERGHSDLNGDPVEAWSYIEAVEYLKNNWKSLGYDSIALDTCDAFLGWLNEYMVGFLKEKDADSKNPRYQDAMDIGDFEFAAGHAAVRNKVIERVTELANIVRNTGQVLITTHMNKTISVRDNKTVIPQKLPNLPEKLAQWLGGMADTICMISRNDRGQNVCTFDGYGESMLGTRLSPLLGKSVVFTKGGDTTLYKQIMRLLNNNGKEA